MDNQIPKTVFDKEYSTQWRREVQFLEEKGIAYVYAKKNARYPIIKYKYTKTPELFLALAEFYNQVRNEAFFKKTERTSEIVSKKLPVEKGCIEINKEDLSKSELKTLDFQIKAEDIEKVFKDDTE